jgi:hypothetical protein
MRLIGLLSINMPNFFKNFEGKQLFGEKQHIMAGGWQLSVIFGSTDNQVPVRQHQ